MVRDEQIVGFCGETKIVKKGRDLRDDDAGRS